MRSIFIFCASMYLCISPANAQELHFNPMLLDSCVSAYEEPNDAYECIGVVYQDCIEINGENRYTSGVCFHNEAALWDSRLNAAYSALMEYHMIRDAEGKASYGDSALEAAPALQEMQRAWIVFRDANCAYGSVAYGNFIRPSAPSGCLMRVTAEQALELEIELAYWSRL